MICKHVVLRLLKAGFLLSFRGQLSSGRDKGLQADAAGLSTHSGLNSLLMKAPAQLNQGMVVQAEDGNVALHGFCHNGTRAGAESFTTRMSISLCRQFDQ